MRLPTQAPFNLEATVRLLQRRPANRIDVWDGHSYWRVLKAGGFTLCRVFNRGSIDAPDLHLEFEPRRDRADARRLALMLRRVLGLDLDAGFDFPGARSAGLGAVAGALRGARPPRFPTLFETLGRVIPYQQLSLDSGTAIAGRLVKRFGKRMDTSAGSIWSFPEPEDLERASAPDFEGIGLNRRKIASLQKIAALIASGSLSEAALEALPTEAALDRLQALPGVGPWTAAVVLLRGLGRMDVFPAGDAGALRGLRAIVGPKLSVPSLIARAGNRRGYLYFHALGARLLREGWIHPERAGVTERPGRRMRAAPGWARAVVYTVGHSTRPLPELIAMLQSAGVRTLADVRTIPRSRTNPQFNESRLSVALPRHGIRYEHLPNLGGLRHAKPGILTNAAWRNASFRGYADYMQTAPFREGLKELQRLASRGPVAAMCAEGNPWRCHRNLLADALWVRGADVRELSAPGRWKPHEPIPFARVQGRQVTYPLPKPPTHR